MSMKQLAGQINPDSSIQVAVSFPNGMVKVYESKKENQAERKFLYGKWFKNYGKARLWCQTFEANNRRMKEKAG